MPINGSTANSTATTSSSAPGGGGRTTFRPPWVKEGSQTATQWRKPSITTDTTPKTDVKTDVTPVKKIVKVGVTPTENGQPSKEVTTKLQSKEIKVPILTEKIKPAPVPLKSKEKEIKVVVEKTEEKPKSTIKFGGVKDSKEKDVKIAEEKPKTILKTVLKDPKEKDTKTVAVEKVEEKPKTILKSALKDTKDKDAKEAAEKPKSAIKTTSIKDPKENEIKIDVVEKVEEIPKPNLKTVNKIQKEITHPEKFVRPVLRKVPKVEDQIIKEVETKVIPFILKATPKIEPKEMEKSKIEPVILQKPKIDPKRDVNFKNGNAAVGKMADSTTEEETDSEEYEEETETEEEETDDESAASTPKTKDTKMSPAPPPPPPAPPGGPPMPPPPPPPLTRPPNFEKKPLTAKHKNFLEKLKTRPRRRPDWSEMMQEVEQGKKLKHVKCNDRSNPVLTCQSMTKVKGEYIYETEKASKHNQLLQQIQSGVKLKTVRTNDRSKPVLEGLRKFRRQMTIEEQIQKSESRAQLNEAPPEEEGDEMDDIDKLRDDLQSTKQLLSIELRNNEAQERENKRLLARVNNLEAELERERWTIDVTQTEEQKKKILEQQQQVTPTDENLVQSLKEEAIEAQKTSKLLENRFHDTAGELDKAKHIIDEQKRQIAALEKKLNQAIQGTYYGNDARRPSEAQQRDSSPECEPEVSESEEEEDEEKKAERRARRLLREVKLLSSKLFRIKEKQKIATKERESLRDAMKKNHTLLKEEKKKYKKLQREVDKMAALMKDDCDDDDEEKEDGDEEPDEEAEEEESEESSEEESEGESDAESDASQSEAEDAPNDKKKENLAPRVKRHEGRLAALKKGNYLLQANVDGLQDEINKTREMSCTLQSDLNSVLSELG